MLIDKNGGPVHPGHHAAAEDGGDTWGSWVAAPIQQAVINLGDFAGRLPGTGVSQALVQRLWQAVEALEIHANGFLKRARDEQIANLQAWRPSKVLMAGATFVGLVSAKIIHSLGCWMFSSPKDDLSSKQIEVKPTGITQAKVEQTAVAVIKAPETQQEHLDARAESHNRKNNNRRL